MTNRWSPDGEANRIAVIGAGHVGATCAYAFLMQGLAREIVLVDLDEARAEGEAMDLGHAVPLASPVHILSGGYADAARADIVVIAAGVGGVNGETRLELLDRNAHVARDIVRRLMDEGFDGILLMTTNPVDVLAQVAQEESGLSAARVLGSGTVLDTSRLRALLGEALGVDPRSVHAYIIGEHGDSEVAAWSSAHVAGVPLTASWGAGLDFDDLLSRVRRAASMIIKRKGYTSFAIGSSVARICRAVLGDERTVLPVSTMTTGQHGIEGVYLSLPCVVGRGGVERVIELSLSPAEKEGLNRSAEVLRRALESCRPG
jgi:L-lactate dehydrogenase